MAFTNEQIQPALAALREHVDEGFIISTCNRVEICGLSTSENDVTARLVRFLAAWHGLAPEEIAPHLYTFRDAEAVQHLYRLAAGLDSMVVGEDQIVSQLKDALMAAHLGGAIGGVLHRLLHSALATGKQVRNNTGIGKNHLSVVSVALDLARRERGNLATERILVLGAGHMAELALKHLRSQAGGAIVIVNRTAARAEALAARYSATAWPYEQLEQALIASDVVICCTSAPRTVIDTPMATRAAAGRDRPLLLLDLAVPRDVDLAVRDVPGALLFDVDDMAPICAANRAARSAEVARAEALIDESVERFMEWWGMQLAVPTIRAIRERAEAIRAAEIQRTLARCPELSEEERRAIDALSAAIVNKLLHDPIATLKDPAAGDEIRSAAQRLFHVSLDS
jgi:glutamyl-tRNA reductase